jgi:phage shock protein C
MKRSKNKIIAGVCGGLAQDMGIDPMWVRFAFLAAFLLFGVGPIIYLIMWVLMASPE